MRAAIVFACLLGFACAGMAHARCGGVFPVGHRTLSFDDGREIPVWYPVGRKPSVAGAPAGGEVVSTCARWPIVLFSHGLAGCGTQAVFITREIARHGYVVVAPNHHDALCGKAVEGHSWNRGEATDPSYLQPGSWDARAHRDRLLDLDEALRRVARDPALGPATDAGRVALMGHSLGGYTALGAAGAWPDWRLPGVRAVLVFSPFVAPFLAERRLAGLRVPVMYQGGTLDVGLSASLEGEGGAFAASPGPKFLVQLRGATHLAWTDWICGDIGDAGRCLAEVENARLIDGYAVAFLDRYLKDRDAPLLSGSGRGLAGWRKAP